MAAILDGRQSRASLALGIFVSALTGSMALAGGPSPVVFRAEAANAAGVGLVEITFESGVWDPDSSSFTYLQETPVDIVSESNGETVASLDNCYLFFRSGAVNEVQIVFSVRAIASDTEFYVDSPILEYLAVPAAEARGRAVASFSITDLDDNGALLVGLGDGAGPGAYSAFLNANCLSSGSMFSNLVNFVYAGQGASAVATQNDPPSGYRSIGQVVRSSMAHFSFESSVNDAVTATTRFNVLGRSEVCMGDVDADRDVDLNDLAGFLAGFGLAANDCGYSPDIDMVLDGVVDIGDLGEMLSQFGSACP